MWLLLALLPALVLAVVRWNWGAGFANEDWAQYLLHARALAEGRPYGDIGYIFTTFQPFVGPPAMPPGLPVTLSVLVRLGLDSPTALSVFMVLLTLLFIHVASRYFAEHEGTSFGLSVALLLGLSPELLAWANFVQSDLPFSLLIWITIGLYDRAGPWTWRRALAISALGLCAMAFRIAGAAVLPAAMLYLVVRRRRQSWLAAVPAVVWLLAAILGALFFARSFSVVRNLRWLTGGFLPDAVTANVVTYSQAFLQALLYPLPGNLANDVYHVVAGAIAVAGAVAWIRAGAAHRYVLCFALVYTTALLVLPFGQLRYLWPVFPVIVFCFVRGLALLARWVAPRADPAKAPAIALRAAIVLALLTSVLLLRGPQSGMFHRHPDARALFAYFRGLENRREARVAFEKPRVLALETGIPAMATFREQTSAIRAELRRQCITHLVVGSLGLAPRKDSTLRALQAWRPEEFELVYRNPSFTAYRLLAFPCRPDASRLEGSAGPEVAEVNTGGKESN